MLVPSVFDRNLFDDFDLFFDDPWFYQDRTKKPVKKTTEHHRTKNIMKTDVKESEKEYVLKIDLPGFKKEEVQAELKDGYLTISAEKCQDTGESEQKSGKYICRERCMEACKRSFYIGEDIVTEDIKASMKHGVLKLTIPKKQPQPEIEQKQYIAIE